MNCGMWVKGGKPLDDIDLLPPDLKEQSLSDREIVLTLENASHAVDYLEAAQWAVIRWEPWLKWASEEQENGAHVLLFLTGPFTVSLPDRWM